MSNLSELLPSGGGQNAVEFTATGTLSNGAIVGLKSDGTVAVLDPDSVGSPADFPSAYNVQLAAACYDSIRDVVHVAYKDLGTQYVTHSAGSISGSTITWGTKTTVSTESPKDIDITMNESIQFPIVAYCQSSGGNVKVRSGSGGSGTSMNWNGNLLIVQAGDNNNCLIRYNPNGSNSSSAETLIVFNVQSNGRGFMAALTTTNSATTSIKYGPTTLAYVAGDQFLPVGLVKIATSNSFLAVFNQLNYSNGNQGCACYQITIGPTQLDYSSGGTIGTSFGASGTSCEESLSSNTHRMASDFNQGTTAVITGSFREGGSGTITMRAYVLTANGTGSAPSVSSAVDMLPGSSGNIFFGTSTVFDPNANKFVTVVGWGTNSYYGTVLTSTQSGTTFTVESGQTSLQSQNIYYDALCIAYSDHSNNVLIASNQNPVSNYRGVMFTAGSLGVDKVIGITAQAISNGASGTVNLLGGINESQSGLTPGTDYYVDASTGQLTATSSGNTLIGTAVSATTLNIKDL